MGIAGRTYVVSGGTNGIGRSIAVLLRESGANVVAIGRNHERAAELERDHSITAVVADVGDEADVARAFAVADARYGRLDGVVSNAAIARPEGLIHEEDLAVLDETIRTNLRGTFLVVREGLRRLVRQEAGGSVVCVSSVVATAAIAGGGAGYTATKGAILSLVRQLAVDYGPRGIRVNALTPGPIETNLMWDTTDPAAVAATRQLVDQAVPLHRIGQPLDCARAVLWLLSDDASYVTGSELVVDGGTNARSVLPV